MLHAKKLSYGFWAEAMNTACYIHNRVTLRSGTTSTLYELWKGRKPTVKYFHVFGSKCYILADREPRRKMDPKSDEGMFLGYSTNNKAYRVYNSRTKTMMESINVVIDDTPGENVQDEAGDAIASDSYNDVPEIVKEPEINTKTPSSESINVPPKKGPSIRIQKNHPLELIIGNPDQGIATRRTNDLVSNSCFVSKFEPKNVKEALTDEF
ncbi:gag-pol polyprotein, partial [Trifolium medium]|nr:gag-pol polyprotein [Trifolium medium]